MVERWDKASEYFQSFFTSSGPARSSNPPNMTQGGYTTNLENAPGTLIGGEDDSDEDDLEETNKHLHHDDDDEEDEAPTQELIDMGQS